MTAEEKAALLDKVDDYKTKYIKTDKWVIVDRDYFDDFPDFIELASAKGHKYQKIKKMIWEYQYGDKVPIKLLHQEIVNALYEERITSDEMMTFIDIIRDTKWLEEDEYDNLVKGEEDGE